MDYVVNNNPNSGGGKSALVLQFFRPVCMHNYHILIAKGRKCYVPRHIVNMDIRLQLHRNERMKTVGKSLSKALSRVGKVRRGQYK